MSEPAASEPAASEPAVSEPTAASDPTVVAPAAGVEPTFRGWMGSMWLYTTLRFGMFGALWGILYLCGLSVYLSALIGLVLSVPLSLVLLAKPRARFTAQLEARVNARRVGLDDLEVQLDPEARERDADLKQAEAQEARLVQMRKGRSRRKG